MAFIHRNALTPAVAKWNNHSATFHKFDKVWDKGEINGVPVYGWCHYYKAKTWVETVELQRFLKSIGIGWDEFRKQEIDKEINDLRFYLKDDYNWDGSTAGDNYWDYPSTGSTTLLVPPEPHEVANVFNAAFTVGTEITVTVIYGGLTSRYIGSHNLELHINDTGIITNSGLNNDQIRAVLESDPWYYLANSTHMPYTRDSKPFQFYDSLIEDMPHSDEQGRTSRLLGTTMTSCTTAEDKGAIIPNRNEALGVFAYMDSSAFEKIGEVFDEEVGTFSSSVINGEALSYKYSQKFVYKGVSAQSKLIQEIDEYYSAMKPLTLKGGKIRYKTIDEYRNELTFHTLDTMHKKALDNLIRYVDKENGGTTGNRTNSLFYDGWLRQEPARLMRRRHFVEMLGGNIDIDSQIEKASFWERAFAYIIVVIAVVVAIFVPPAGAFILKGGTIAWAAIATSTGYAALILTVGMYALSYFGGLSVQGLVKNIGAFAQIVGIIAVVTGVMAAIQSAGKILAQKTLNLTVADAATAAGKDLIRDEMLKQTLTDQLSGLLEQTFDSITSKIGEFVSLDLKQQVSFIQDGVDLIFKGLNSYEDKEAAELERDLAIQEEEAAEAEAENLSNQLKNPAAVYVMMENDITSYDAISTLDHKMQATVGKDKSYSMWNSNVNSV